MNFQTKFFIKVGTGASGWCHGCSNEIVVFSVLYCDVDIYIRGKEEREREEKKNKNPFLSDDD